MPIVVAINKCDKEGASPDRVKQELSEQNLLAEEWGGDVVMVPVSAIKGENIDKLLEMILLVTEVEDLQANPDRLARHRDRGTPRQSQGPVATLLVQNGTLKTGDVLAAGPVLGKVRAMVDDAGKRMKEAGPSFAVEALGFSEVPTAGDEFEVYPDEKSARAVVGDRASDARATRLAQQMASRRVSLTAMSGQASDGELKELNLILKADVRAVWKDPRIAGTAAQGRSAGACAAVGTGRNHRDRRRPRSRFRRCDRGLQHLHGIRRQARCRCDGCGCP